MEYSCWLVSYSGSNVAPCQCVYVFNAAQTPLHLTTLRARKSAVTRAFSLSSGKVAHAESARRVSSIVRRVVKPRWDSPIGALIVRVAGGRRTGVTYRETARGYLLKKWALGPLVPCQL